MNPITNTSSIDYKEAGDRGYFKLDITKCLYSTLNPRLKYIIRKDYRFVLSEPATNCSRGEHNPLKKTRSEYRTTSGSTSNDKTSKEKSYREVMARYNEGRMDKTK